MISLNARINESMDEIFLLTDRYGHHGLNL